MSTPLKILLVYIGIMSVLSILICIYDKLFSKLNNVKFRVPEKSLLIFSALGGSAAMYICMLLIRHKTKHKKFMIGIPAIIVVQVAAVALCIYAGIL